MLGRLATDFGQGDWRWVTTLQFPDRRTDGFTRAGVVPDAACRVVIIGFMAPVPDSIPPAVTVVDYREATPDLASHLAECNAGLTAALERVPGSSAPSRSNVVVLFGSAHDGPPSPTFIEWRAVLDSATMAWLSRIPVTVTRHRIEGATSDDIRHEELSPGEARFIGQSSGRILGLPCEPSTCKVPPEAVLKVFD